MEDKKEAIIRAAIKGVRMYGLDGLRTQRIGELSGGTTSSIYTYFSGKDELMLACFERIDRQIAHIFDGVRLDPQGMLTDPEGEVRRLWTPYWRWLIAHPDETVFYHRYRDTPAFPVYDRSRDVSYFASFLASFQAFDTQYHVYEKVETHILWLHVLTTTVMYAKYVALGVLPPGPETEEGVFRLISRGLHGLLEPAGGEAPS